MRGDEQDCEPEPLKPVHVMEYVGGAADTEAQAEVKRNEGQAKKVDGQDVGVVFVESAATREFKRFRGNVKSLTGRLQQESKVGGYLCLCCRCRVLLHTASCVTLGLIRYFVCAPGVVDVATRLHAVEIDARNTSRR